ncbi:MAG: hypothetical protein AB7H79_08960 [Sphingomonas sp.]
MIRHFVIAASTVLLACAASPPAVAQQVPERVDWTIAPADRDGGQIQLSIGYRSGRGRSMWSNTTDLSELDGLTSQQLAGDGLPIRFRIVREAGRFDCEGVARRGRGAGECRFEADPAFATTLSRHRIAAPTRSQSYSLALARVGIALIEELGRQDYQRPEVDDLVSAGVHRVDVAYVRGMANAGYRVGTVDGLVRMRIHRVTPDYIEALAAAGYRPSADMAVRLRIHGATPDYIRALAAAGGTGYGTDDLVNMRIHRVSPEFIGALRSMGYERLSASQLTSMRIHRVEADFIRRMNEAAGRRLTPEELVSRRLRPDRFGGL